MDGDELKQTVKERYGQAALRAGGGERGSCGGTGSCGCDPVSSNLYDPADTAALPEGAVLASLGCGNPTALAELHEGEVVLDLGSGGGIDVLLSAKRVGPTGRSEEHTSELQSRLHLVCRLLLEKKKRKQQPN